MSTSNDLQERSINTIRFLSADAINKANSGHPGLPMGVAAIAYTLWTRVLRYNPKNPKWFGRDRFILSGGHGSMLLYSMLYLSGYDLELEEIKNFRQWGSRTPGHPEYGLTPGVEVTTGPLGQGFSNGVGMAIAAEHLAAEFNRPGNELIGHYIYAIVTDGDLMEGVTSEAASLAGHLKLGRLIYIYDDNRISIDGSTDITFTEDRAARFEAYGWHVLHVADGNDVDAVQAAVELAKLDPRPSLIIARTHIGFGLPTRQDTPEAHGSPPDEAELNGAKVNLGWPLEPRFFVPEDVLAFFRKAVDRGALAQQEWDAQLEAYRQEYPQLAAEFDRRVKADLPANWDQGLPEFPGDEKGMATRIASGKVLNALASHVPELIGGSADLTPSNQTWIDGSPSFQPESYQGRNFHFGVREHAMGAALNGMAVHGGVIPYGGTFLVFSDYVRPAIRLSALSHYPTIWIFTHDSIGLGEDGPTHQPVEHLAALRAIPGLVVLRPGDANEVREAWKIALERRNAPTVLALSRHNAPTLDRGVYAPADGVRKGAYILADLGDSPPDLILMSNGTELSLAVEAGKRLVGLGRGVRLVSFPSWELFEAQDPDYREQVLPAHVTARLAIEAGISMGWERWVGAHGATITVDRFGASAPQKVLYEKYGLSVEHIVTTAANLR